MGPAPNAAAGQIPQRSRYLFLSLNATGKIVCSGYTPAIVGGGCPLPPTWPCCFAAAAGEGRGKQAVAEEQKQP
nr:unnamed protein product [Digitaria exilis]